MKSDVPLLQESANVLAARLHWQHRGARRPEFAEEPGPGQESVWDYPRPPLIEAVPEALSVRVGDTLIAATNRGVRVLETAGAPTYYFPPDDVMTDLSPSGHQSLCEWKGLAQSVNVLNIKDAGWRYTQMFPAFASLHLWVAFYPAKLDCFIDQERAKPQPGGYYGGWVSKKLCGPIKGEPGSGNW